ncbi:unnamed protein product [Spirodela intermedia]|uniref:Uncharacterized protein n=1 Tax=Spirodela intermedia TaxID=51605 RepID=A0ABN7EAL1_SPIIN|nr:unnamed protein product [Spirodela intermedia]
MARRKNGCSSKREEREGSQKDGKKRMWEKRKRESGEDLDGGGRVLESFILRSTQQEEALHCICCPRLF